jgi:hypothetical protein
MRQCLDNRLFLVRRERGRGNRDHVNIAAAMKVPAQRGRADEVSAHQAIPEQVVEALNHRLCEPVDLRRERAACLVVIPQPAHHASLPDTS